MGNKTIPDSINGDDRDLQNRSFETNDSDGKAEVKNENSGSVLTLSDKVTC
jgi:hypothetical protein